MQADKPVDLKATSFREATKGVLNEEQEAAVFAEGGPLLIIAGAGSGKTRTLTYRVAHLVHTGIPVERILLCTFTKKAAEEMTDRVESLLHRSLEAMWAGTFHHIAVRILRRHADRLGFGNHFTILDRDDTAQLIDQVIAEAGVGDEGRRFPKGKALCEVFGLSVSTGYDIDSLIPERFPRLTPIIDEIDTVFEAFRERKLAMNLMDFDDLLFFWHQLLSKHADLQAFYADHFLHLLVDEYQDTNPLQAEIIRLLSSKRRQLTVVGDDAQSIYSFRGAEPRHILDFPSQFKDSKILYLTENYRSRPEILAISHRVIEHNVHQFEKKLRPTRPEGEKPVLHVASDSRFEALFLVEQIQKLHSAGMPFDEMAVLYRVHAHSIELQIALQRAHIPFALRSGLRLFEQAHIKDVLAFLRVLQNPQDQMAWLRLLPLFKGVGKETVKKVWMLLEESGFAIESLRADKTKKRLAKTASQAIDWVGRLLEEGAQIAQREIPGQIIRKFYEQEYSEYLATAYDNATKRAEDIRQLATMADAYPSLRSFLDELVLVSEPASVLDEGIQDDDRGAVVLSTIHQAKGLEWQAVFLLNLSEGSFPFFLARSLEEIEEERRLFYVACTRAKDRLFLIHRREAQKSSYREAWTIPAPSRFLAEIFIPPDSDELLSPPSLDDLLLWAEKKPLLALGDRHR